MAASAVLVALGGATAPAATTPTPDQQLASSARASRTAVRAAVRALARPATANAAFAQLERAARAVRTAADVAGRAVGALATPSVAQALARGPGLLRRARADLAARRRPSARAKAVAAEALLSAAIRDFGLPLARDFAAFAVDRDFTSVRGFADYSGFTATAAEEVTDVVIGAADRETANAGEWTTVVDSGDGLPITRMSVYVIRDPIGRFTSNWCSLQEGLITCRLRPTLRPDYSYTIAFGPKLEPGTEVLVKFRTADARRSFVVFTTR